MVGDLLDVTHTRLGQGLPRAPGAANLGKACRQVVDELEAFHPERRLRYFCERGLAGRWDAAHIAQMLSNLLANAIQHGRPDARVIVAVRGEADTVIVRLHNEVLGLCLPRFCPADRSTADYGQRYLGGRFCIDQLPDGLYSCAAGGRSAVDLTKLRIGDWQAVKGLLVVHAPGGAPQ